MKILNKMTLKNMFLHGERTIVTIISVILVGMLMFIVGFSGSIVRIQDIRQHEITYGTYHAIYKDHDDDILNSINNDSKIKDVYKVKSLNTVTTNDNFELSFDLFGGNSDFFSKIRLSSGRLPQNENEIIVYGEHGRYSNSEFGEVIEFSYEGEIYSYTIVGKYDRLPVGIDSNKNEKIFTNYYDDKADYYVTYKSVEKVIDHIIDFSENTLHEECDISKEGRYCSNLSINTPLLSIYGETDGLEYVNYAIIFLLVLFLTFIIGFFGAFVIYNSFAISVVERKKTFGILNSVGATHTSLMMSAFVESLIIIAVSVPISFLLSYASVKLVVPVINDMFAFTGRIPFELSMYPVFIFLPVIMIILSVLFSGFSSALRAREITPIEAISMRDDIKVKGNKLKAPKLIRKLFGIPGEIAYKNMKRNKKKYRITVFSCVCSIVFFVIFGIFCNLMDNMNELANNTDNYDIEISLSDNELSRMDKLFNDLKENKYVDKISYMVGFPVVIPYDEIRYNIVPEAQDYYDNYFKSSKTSRRVGLLLYFVDSDTYDEYKKDTNLKSDSILYNRLVLPNFNNDEFNYDGKIFNEKIPLKLCKPSDAESCNITVTNYEISYKPPWFINVDYYFIPSLIMPFSSYDEYKSYSSTYDNLVYSNIMIKSKKWNEFEKNFFGDIINFDKYKVNSTSYYNYAREVYQIRKNYNALKTIIYSVIAFISLISITTLFNTISTSILLRKKEFAVLKSIGMTPRQFNKMIRCESLFFALKSFIYGVIVSIVLFGVFFRIFFIVDISTNEKIRKIMPSIYSPLILSFIGTTFLVLMIMLYSSRKFKNEIIADTLKKDIY